MSRTYFRVAAGPSTLSGVGCFAAEPIPMGSVVFIEAEDDDFHLLSEAEYLTKAAANPIYGTYFGIRYVVDLFVDENRTDVPASEWAEQGFLYNHSFNPNLLWHCGLLFSLRDIDAGEELTFDYRLACSPREPTFVDRVSGKSMSYMDGQAALLSSTRQLLGMLETVLDRVEEAV